MSSIFSAVVLVVMSLAAFAPQPQNRAALLDPDHSEWSTGAPDRFRARFITSKGEFVVDVHRDWAPIGADRKSVV